MKSVYTFGTCKKPGIFRVNLASPNESKYESSRQLIKTYVISGTKNISPYH